MGNYLKMKFENWYSLCYIRIQVSNRSLIFKYLDNEVMGKKVTQPFKSTDLSLSFFQIIEIVCWFFLSFPFFIFSGWMIIKYTARGNLNEENN